MGVAEHYALKKPLLGHDTECGDAVFIRDDGRECFIALLDALGHGPKAYDIACRALAYLEREYRRELPEMMAGLHKCLRQTRGAVAFLCRLDLDDGELRYAGIGNISARTFGAAPGKLLSADGIVGYSMATPREETASLFDGDTLLLCTDGIREHLDLDAHPDLLNADVKTVVARVIYQFGKGNDDAACVALRYSK